jgi:hypothetical protein
MNEYIKELLLKVVPMEGEDGDLFPSLYTEKQIEEFAELIVRECADKVDWILAEGGKTQGDLIKEHFGVKR